VGYGLARLVGQQVLLRHVGDVRGFSVLGEQVVERLILVGTHVFGDRQPPLLGVGEHRVDVIDHAPERIEPVAHDLADLELGVACFHVGNLGVIPYP